MSGKLLKRLFTEKGLDYFCLIFLIFLSGFSCNYIYKALNTPISPLNEIQIEAEYKNYVFEIPEKQNDLMGIFINNVIVVFIIFIPILFLYVSIRNGQSFFYFYIMQFVLYSLIFFIIGINTFPKFYSFATQHPISITMSYYLPHGIFEIPAFLLSGTTVLIFRDRFRQLFLKNNRDPDLGNLIKNQIFELIPCILLIIALIAIGALIETQITPFILKKAYEIYTFQV